MAQKSHITTQSHAGGYDEERTRGRIWLRIRETVLIEEPICRICKRRPSTQVDHIIPVSQGGTDERDNLQGICEPCHDKKTREDLGYKEGPREIGLDGYPIPDEEQDG